MNLLGPILLAVVVALVLAAVGMSRHRKESLIRLLRRILVGVAIALVLVIVGVYWVGPVSASFLIARKLPRNARLTPADLKDLSISRAPGLRASYMGYEFDLPWSDLDNAHTRLYPEENPSRVVMPFHSGLVLTVNAVPPGEWAKGLATTFKVSPQTLQAALGPETMQSDYSFLNMLYEFTPERMNYWAISPRVHYREGFLLMIKSLALLPCADSGIFRIQNQRYKGFQQGDPAARNKEILVNLYSDEDSIELSFRQGKYLKEGGVTQPEINRIVQSLNKASH